MNRARPIDRNLKRNAEKPGFEVPAWVERAGLADAYIKRGLEVDEFAAAQLCRNRLDLRRRKVVKR